MRGGLLVLALVLRAGGPVGAAEERPVLLAACDELAGWRGASVDREVRQSGSGALRWVHGEAAAVVWQPAVADWSQRTALALWLHNAQPSTASFMVIARSPNPASEGDDYYQFRVSLNFRGWRRLVIPRSALIPTRQPRGWDQIDELVLTARGWEQTLDPTVVVHLDQLELVDMVGPLITDPELFTALDLELPALAAVQTAVAAADWPAARLALGQYLRQRRSVPWWFDPQQPTRSTRYDQAAAERTVRGEIQQVTLWHAFADGQIDWFYNPTTASAALPDNHEWQWQLNRMGFWGGLGAAWWGSGDERYALAWVQQLRSWVRDCPRPEKVQNSVRSAWRTIETGIRLCGSWPNAYHRFLSSPSVTPDDLVLYLSSTLEQARYLRQFPTSGNWLTMELNGLYTAGALFPELREAAEWRQYAIGRLYDELATQFLPDGAQIELTPGYHQVALGNILALPRLARLVGRGGEFPADFTQRMARAFEYNLALRTPDDDLPRFNDSWRVRVSGSLEPTAELFADRADLQWGRTNGQQGTPPAYTSRALPYAGYYVLRSGWERDANYAVLDAGPLGYGHYHQDKLNFVAWAYGRGLLFDGGGGSYESSPYRRYATDTFGHNCVLVDGLPQRRDASNRQQLYAKAPLDNPFETSAAADYVAGTYADGWGKVEDRRAVHVRRGLFLKPDLWIVADTLTPADAAEHTYQARWHLATTRTSRHGNLVATSDADLPNLAVQPLQEAGLTVQVASCQTAPELLGWWVDKDTDPQYKPATTVLHTRRGTGPQTFLTALQPLRPGLVPSLTATALDAVTWELRWGDRKVRLTVPPEAGQPLTWR
ncbi:MAG: heparinase II/III family protein [Fimbriimonadaceae bacterium]|nr:heparinase II/III family protein [Fimbriimonadaceae bacterium]